MKILLISQERPLDEKEVVTGNAVRNRQIMEGLTRAGHQVESAWLRAGKEKSRSKSEFRNGDELHSIISRCDPDAVLIGYWELATLLPYDLRIPVVLDFVAPRPLEELFESPDSVQASLRRLRNVLRRCDLVMVGNDQQRHLLIYNLIEAGFDLRHQLPVLVVPLGARLVERKQQPSFDSGWTLVAGGVDWPWRNSSVWNRKLSEAIDPTDSRLVIFGGRYRWHERKTQAKGQQTANAVDPQAHDGVQHRNLEAYRNFSHFLSSEGHIGTELADENIERTYSQSFRSLEFLRHGLPLICNRYLPIAELIERHDAGWLVDEPGEIEPLLREITSQPDAWRTKSDNARRLVATDLNSEATLHPLIEWLKNPTLADRLEREPATDDHPPVLGVPPMRTRIARQWSLLRKFFLPRVLRLGGSGQERSGKGVIIVTRGDLFPADHGAAVRTIETAQALARQGLRVGLVTDNRKHWYQFNRDEIQENRFPWWSRLLSLPAPISKLLHHSKDLPHSDSFLYQPLSDGSWFWRILIANQSISADVLQAEFPAYAAPCLDAAQTLKCGVVMVEHNVEYQRMQAQVAELTQAQYDNLRAIELDLCRRVNAVVCVSDNDRRQLEEDGVNPDRLHVIPHGVDLSADSTSTEIDVRTRFGVGEDSTLLVFHGTYSYPPNLEVLGTFANIILPGLEKLGVQCHVLAFGKDAPPVSPHQRIHLTGSVSSVGPWLRAADIAVVPLMEGGGTRMKILDYFAAGLPVVSTSKGIEGIPARHGREAMIVDDWEEFVQTIANLCGDESRATALGKNGRAFVEDLGWDAIGKRYLKVFASIGR